MYTDGTGTLYLYTQNIYEKWRMEEYLNDFDEHWMKITDEISSKQKQ